MPWRRAKLDCSARAICPVARRRDHLSVGSSAREQPRRAAPASPVGCRRARLRRARSMPAISTSFRAISGRPAPSAIGTARLVQRVGLERRQRRTRARTRRATSSTCARTAPSGERAVADLLELAPLPEVERDGDDLGAVMLARARGWRPSRSRPPEYGEDDPAITLQSLRTSSSRLTSAAARRPSLRDHQNGVVAGDGADGLRQLRAVDGEGERLRLAGAGADDDQLLHAVDAAQELGGRALERAQRRLGIGGRRRRAAGRRRRRRA